MHDPATRYAGVVLLIALCGVAAGMVIQLRHVLTRPVVADDAGSLKADFLMRVEDAREVATPTVVWCLPAASVLDSALGRRNTAWLVFAALSALTLVLITVRTARSGTAASAGPTGNWRRRG
ncbi:hypothetical protein ACFYXC_14230 [Streptomyces sp. NPDC002701]|uniref:hypothetical protein n=1 Tax=Streptomyces sp. NPDC002701 TaxID=3364661 RepID=UPI0036CF8D87